MGRYYDSDAEEPTEDGLNVLRAIDQADERDKELFARRFLEFIDGVAGNETGVRPAEPFQSSTGEYPDWVRKR